MVENQINLFESIISVKGKIFWNDGRRRIDLKKPIKDIFEPLESSHNKINYTMELCLSKQKVLDRTQELLNKGTIPILFYFTKENKNAEQMS